MQPIAQTTIFPVDAIVCQRSWEFVTMLAFKLTQFTFCTPATENTIEGLQMSLLFYLRAAKLHLNTQLNILTNETKYVFTGMYCKIQCVTECE